MINLLILTYFLLLGKQIIQSLKEKIVVLCIDEAHASLRSQWGHSGMREEMYLAPAYLRAQLLTTTKAPILAMTASAKVGIKSKTDKSEIQDIQEMCSIKFSPTTVIQISPVLHNHVYMNLLKPPSVYKFYGRDSYSFSDQKIGSVHVLWGIYLKYFVSDVTSGKVPKKGMIYVNNLKDLMDIEGFLNDQLGHLECARYHKTCPWVTMSSATGRVDFLFLCLLKIDKV